MGDPNLLRQESLAKTIQDLSNMHRSWGALNKDFGDGKKGVEKAEKE